MRPPRTGCQNALGVKRHDGGRVMPAPAAFPHICPPLGCLPGLARHGAGRVPLALRISHTAGSVRAKRRAGPVPAPDCDQLMRRSGPPFGRPREFCGFRAPMRARLERARGMSPARRPYCGRTTSSRGLRDPRRRRWQRRAAQAASNREMGLLQPMLRTRPMPLPGRALVRGRPRSGYRRSFRGDATG